MADFNEIINTRRSIRAYSDKEVEDEKIEKILRAGMQAPGSRKGSEPHEFIVVKNRDTLNKLGEIKPRAMDCNTAIVLLANIDRSFYKAVWQQDMSAVAENMLLEACNLGLGGLWNGVAPLDEVMDPISEIFDLPENVKPFCLITLGYPTEDSTNEFVDKYDPERIHYEKY
ncbi:MAG: nitroreductase family protein [Methanosphaera sp.]|nr:nitroreductase family protein [Methanosphaera sp.]